MILKRFLEILKPNVQIPNLANPATGGCPGEQVRNVSEQVANEFAERSRNEPKARRVCSRSSSTPKKWVVGKPGG